MSVNPTASSQSTPPSSTNNEPIAHRTRSALQRKIQEDPRIAKMRAELLGLRVKQQSQTMPTAEQLAKDLSAYLTTVKIAELEAEIKKAAQSYLEKQYK